MRDLPIARDVAQLRAHVAAWRLAGDSIGLVPTMGALHDGHVALADRARAENRRVIATIFVNPTQFGAGEDLGAYPRDEAGDVAKLIAAQCDLLFAPSADTMYPTGFATSVQVAELTQHLCGAMRPGHFTGVATVVTKLLLQALPDRAYFGEKDFQQLQVIRRLATDLDIPAEIVGVPTVREPDGLALSSRNRYLSAAERAVAATLPRLLREAAAALSSGAPVEATLRAATAALFTAGFTKVDYVALCDEARLQPLDHPVAGSRLFAAAHLGRTRLIDNWPVA